MRTLAMSRPARVVSGEAELDAEYRAARYLYHRLLDFEDDHQRVMDEAQEECAPGITRVSKLLARLRKRKRRAERSTGWVPGHHPAVADALGKRLSELRKTRNADPRWKAAMGWADAPSPSAPARGRTRRKRTEGWTGFLMRDHDRRVSGRDRRSRREQRRHELYEAHAGADANERSRVYWGTWNALTRSVDQARADVLKLRRQGMPAEWRRPRWSDTGSIHADAGGFRVVRRGGHDRRGKGGAIVGDPWWEVKVRLHDGWARVRAKLGNWHDIPEGAEWRTCKVTRRHVAGSWRYSVSITVAGMPDDITYSVGHVPDVKGHGRKGRRELLAGQGVVGIDWGHREHGHPNEQHGIRAFTWVGDDGRRGEILLPTECRKLLDEIDSMKSRIDTTFQARGAPERNRHRYRSRLMRQGVRTEEECRWLQWETRYEKRIARARSRIANVREQTYLEAVRELRVHYEHFVIEDEPGKHHQRLDVDEQSRRRKRQNRDMVARYLFLTICERLGGVIIPVSARNTTRQCPSCGRLAENGPELLIACPGCGTIEDKDERAANEILLRGQVALAEQEAAQ